MKIVAVDADANQHLGPVLSLGEAEAAALPTRGERLSLIKDYLRGANPRIASAATMIKTTPPGECSRLAAQVDPAFVLGGVWRLPADPYPLAPGAPGTPLGAGAGRAARKDAQP